MLIQLFQFVNVLLPKPETSQDKLKWKNIVRGGRIAEKDLELVQSWGLNQRTGQRINVKDRKYVSGQWKTKLGQIKKKESCGDLADF